MELLAANPRAVPLGGAGRPASRPTRRPADTAPRVLELHPAPHPAWVILAQFESGNIVASVTSNVNDWRDEAARLEAIHNGRFSAFRFVSTEAARAAIQALANEIHAQFGAMAGCADQHLYKSFRADWPIVLDTFIRQNHIGHDEVAA